MAQALQKHKRLKNCLQKCEMINKTAIVFDYCSSSAAVAHYTLRCVLPNSSYPLVILHIHLVFGLLQQPNIAPCSQPENKVEHAPWICLHPGLISLILKQDVHDRELIFCVNKLQFVSWGCLAGFLSEPAHD